MEELIGRTLENGRYQLRAVLGRGGMGTVFTAVELNLGREVAIKVLNPSLTYSSGLIQRFQREAKAIARLEHEPHILPIYAFGEEDGLFYLVMRLVTGGTLKDRLQTSGQPWSLRQALQLAQQVLPTLDVVHQAGIIHRDLKPSNILLEGEWVYIADFGIAKAVQEELQEELLTRPGMLLGTPEYMAPEQVLGLPLDGRADLYAFGVVLYEVLAGRVPFHGETSMQTALQHVHAALPRPRELNPQLARAVEVVLLQALAREPEKRFASGAALLEALTQAIEETEGQLPEHGIETKGTRSLPVVGLKTQVATEVRGETGETVQGNTVGPSGRGMAAEQGKAIERGPPTVPGGSARDSGGAGQVEARATRSWRGKPLVLLGGLVLLLGLVGVGGYLLLSRTAGTETPIPSPAKAGGFPLHDDFANPSSDWAQSHQPDYTAEYVNGGYRMMVNKPGPFIRAQVPAPLVNVTMPDMRVEVEATKVGGPNNGAFGLICRAHVAGEGIDRFYAFEISGDGKYVAWKQLESGEQTVLGTGQWQSSNVINQGQATNQLRADCVGNRLAFYVNGQKLLEVQDGDITSGAAGLLVRTPPGTAGTDVVFHYFSAEPAGPVQPPSQEPSPTLAERER